MCLDPVVAHTGEIVGGIVGGLAFIIAAVVLILYRNWKYEQELDSLLWKVNYKDIQIKEQKKDETAGANEAPAKCNSKVTARFDVAARILVKILVPNVSSYLLPSSLPVCLSLSLSLRDQLVVR